MKGFWRRVVSALVIVGAGWVTLLACAHDDSTLFVFDVLAGTASGTSCGFTADPTQPTIGGGVLDLAVRSEYDAMYLLANQMVAQADPSIPQTESGFITVDHVNVRITDALGAQIRAYSTVVAATGFPATGTTPSFFLSEVPTIDQQAAQVIGGFPPGGPTLPYGVVKRIETFVRFFGHTTGGTSVESNTFEFPVDVCYGCLISWPLEEQDLGARTPNCGLASTANTSTTSTPTPCRFGQDAPYDCSLCRSSVPICLDGPPPP